MELLSSYMNLAAGDALHIALAVLAAGIIRGFAGFGLTALVMASSALILPPADLIPICWILEASATAVVLRGGWKEADKEVSVGLALGALIGVPIGLALTVAIAVETSKTTALVLVAVLAALQLAKIRFAFLATKPGLYGAGTFAGVAYGLAGLGGMVASLYVLSSGRPAPAMRGSLILYLLFSAATQPLLLWLFDLLTWEATIRGLILAPLAAIGAFIGARAFTPKYAAYYRPFCLTLLIGLALVGLARLAM